MREFRCARLAGSGSQLGQGKRSVGSWWHEEVLPVRRPEHRVQPLAETALEREPCPVRENAVHREPDPSEVVRGGIEDDEVDAGAGGRAHLISDGRRAPGERIVDGVEVGPLRYCRAFPVDGSVV